MSDYQTGDLLLANQWSLGSILNHSLDPESRWSDVGIFVVDQQGIRDRSNDGYRLSQNESNGKSAKTGNSIRVVLMTPHGVRAVNLDELLRIPSFQAAAHRPLAVSNRKVIQQAMAGYIETIIKMAEETPHRIVSNPFPSSLRQSLTGGVSTQYTKSNHGTLLDNKGRDVKVSGFVKGNPDSQIKTDFTAADFIGSILAQAELIKYDPEIKISDFQQGGRLDDIYGDEAPLFPRKSAEDARQYLIQKARQDAELLVLQYFDALPVSTFNRYKNSTPFPAPRAERYEENEQVEPDEDMDHGTGYPDQNLSAYSTVAAHERRGNTNAIGLIVESDTIDLKIRQRDAEAKKYSRPVPSYRSTAK